MVLLDEQHLCEEFLSQCCGAGEHEHVAGFCGRCLEATGFECSICGKLWDDVFGAFERSQ